MGNLTLLERFADVDLLRAMPMGEKMLAALIVTILGMGVTFIVLVILWGIISLMTRVLTGAQPKKEAQPAPVEPKVVEQPAAAEMQEDDSELVAVITAAIAASMQTSIHNIYVQNIVRVPDATPAWGRAARLDQMDSRF